GRPRTPIPHTAATTASTTQPLRVVATALTARAARATPSGPRRRDHTTRPEADRPGVSARSPLGSRSADESGAAPARQNAAPTRTTSANAVRSRLLARNAPSREAKELRRGAEETR